MKPSRLCAVTVLLASSLLVASCMPASRASRAPDARQPVVVSLTPESLRALRQHSPGSLRPLSQYGTQSTIQAQLDDTLMECRPAEAQHQRVSTDETRIGLYRAVAGFVAGAVITPALAAVSPRVGAAWVNVLNEFQGRHDTAIKGSMWCRPVR